MLTYVNVFDRIFIIFSGFVKGENNEISESHNKRV